MLYVIYPEPSHPIKLIRNKISPRMSALTHRQVWQGVQHLTNYRTTITAVEGNPSLAEELNIFLARFKAEPPEAATSHPTVHSIFTFTVEEHEVRRTLRAINPRKAAGPDGVTGRVLKDFADQLAGVFTRIFNQSLAQSTVPLWLKSSTTVPLPKKHNISCLNDYRPVTLTPVVMKCFVKLLWGHIALLLPWGFDPHQFAYRTNRSTEDGVATALHAALSHLKKQGRYVRMLFVDFSSAFNTILPHRLVDILGDLGFLQNICMWIKSFLSCRSQRMRVRASRHTSSLSLSTRAVYWASCSTPSTYTTAPPPSFIQHRRSLTALSPHWKIYTDPLLPIKHRTMKDTSHTGHSLFKLLLSGRLYRYIMSGTTRFSNSFYPNAVVTLNAMRWNVLLLLFMFSFCCLSWV